MDLSLPELTLPPTLPAFIMPTSASRGSLYSNWKPTTGNARRRRVRTSRPETRECWLLLNKQQLYLFDTWWEASMEVGARFFSARVAGTTGAPKMKWYRAKAITPPKTEPLKGGEFTRVSMDLLLVGPGSDLGPTTTTAALEVFIDFNGTAAATIYNNAEVEVTIDLESRHTSGAEISIALTSTPEVAAEVRIGLYSLTTAAAEISIHG